MLFDKSSMYMQGQQQHRAGGMPSDLNDNDRVPMTFPCDDEDDDVTGKLKKRQLFELYALTIPDHTAPPFCKLRQPVTKQPRAY